MRSAVHLMIGVVIASVVLHTWLVMGLILPVTVSGSSMAPALLGPHRRYDCPNCRRDFVVGLDQLPREDAAVCPDCSRRRATSQRRDHRGERLAVDRSAFDWRAPRRWEVIVFRCPKNASELCVKRVVGLPGETVVLDRGDVLVDGRIVRKSLAEQRATRQLSYATGDDRVTDTVRVGDVLFPALPRWRLSESDRFEYHHLNDDPITDEFSYNQGPTAPTNRVADFMVTFDARLAGVGELTLTAENQAGRVELAVDFGRRRVDMQRGAQVRAEYSLPATASGRFVRWTFSLFDRQVLLAIDDVIVLIEPWDGNQMSNSAGLGPPFSIGVGDLKGEIRRLAVWRDAFYAIRHGDGRQPGVLRGVTTTWRLGADEFFVLGDNAAISDDSRSWLPDPGVDAKLLIGKPLGVR